MRSDRPQPCARVRRTTADVAVTAPEVRRPNWFALVCAVAVGAGVLLRMYSGSALWLDETLSVNISALPVGSLLDALRHDGSPPLYYFILHVWMAVFGSSDLAVRALSSLASVAALPVGYRLGRRLGGRPGGAAALVVLATNPFLVRYATETRMYSLVVLLVLAAALLIVRAVERATLGRLIPVAVLAGSLSLTHYWTFFPQIAAIAALAVLGVRADHRRAYWQTAGAIVAGQLFLLPWLPSFFFQARNTGTPWAPSARLTDLVVAWQDWAGGPRWFAWPLALILLALLITAVWRHPWGEAADGGTSPQFRRAARALTAVAIGGLVLGLIASGIQHAGYASRYTAPSAALVLVASGLGLARLPAGARRGATALMAVVGLAVSVVTIAADDRSQSRDTAALLLELAAPGDVVVYCPDQLGPAVSREIGARGSLVEVTYPTLAAPQRIDWVSYAARNEGADPAAIGRAIEQRTAGSVWLVMRPGYLTYGTQCEQLAAVLAGLRGPATVVQHADTRFYESEDLLRFGPR